MTPKSIGIHGGSGLSLRRSAKYTLGSPITTWLVNEIGNTAVSRTFRGTWEVIPIDPKRSLPSSIHAARLQGQEFETRRELMVLLALAMSF